MDSFKGGDFIAPINEDSITPLYDPNNQNLFYRWWFQPNCNILILVKLHNFPKQGWT